MTCKQCKASKQRPQSGLYSFKCVECCCRLVLTAHPDKMQAQAMLAAIERFPESPGRDVVLESVRHELAKRPSAPQKLVTQ